MSPQPTTNEETNAPPPLEALLDAAWAAVEAGIRDSRHGWHLGAIASNGPGGLPDLRTVVLRSLDRTERAIGFHTDARSEKIRDLALDDRVGVLLYDRDLRIQLRARGRASIHLDDPLADAAWAASSLSSRRCYLAPYAPSCVLESFSPNLPPELLHHVPDAATSEGGRAHFALVRCRLDMLEWLHLRHDGHHRARFDWDAEGIRTDRWLAP